MSSTSRVLRLEVTEVEKRAAQRGGGVVKKGRAGETAVNNRDGEEGGGERGYREARLHTDAHLISMQRAVPRGYPEVTPNVRGDVLYGTVILPPSLYPDT